MTAEPEWVQCELLCNTTNKYHSHAEQCWFFFFNAFALFSICVGLHKSLFSKVRSKGPENTQTLFHLDSHTSAVILVTLYTTRLRYLAVSWKRVSQTRGEEQLVIERRRNRVYLHNKKPSRFHLQDNSQLYLDNLSSSSFYSNWVKKK